MDGLKAFIENGIKRWEEVKTHFAHDQAMTAFLKKSHIVVVFDHHQLDIDFARNLGKPALGDKKNPKPDELAREEFRRGMASYLKNDLRELFMEVRFPHIEIDLIQDLKVHPVIKGINSGSRASIRVAVLKESFNREETV